ncbi:hypothetical protein [Burkholderia gladioli]|uniref:hypothetical protein n=1 Tax=Burkholderia gladioli TaxID=28095 RepID=UPI0016418E5C|nr:hypothetical protein [Burkholderia gladioli]
MGFDAGSIVLQFRLRKRCYEPIFKFKHMSGKNLPGKITPPDHQFITWLFLGVVIPVAIYPISWAIAALVLNQSDSFISTFGTAELLPIAALILFGVISDIDQDAYFSEVSKSFLYSKHLAFLAGVVMLVFYGSLKGRALTLLVADGKLPPSELAIRSSQLMWFSIVSILSLISAVTYCLWLKIAILKKQLTDLLKREVAA